MQFTLAVEITKRKREIGIKSNKTAEIPKLIVSLPQCLVKRNICQTNLTTVSYPVISTLKRPIGPVPIKVTLYNSTQFPTS
jgi:hypothetical protein